MHLYPLSGTRVTRFVCSLNDLKHFTILVVNPKWQQAFGIGIDLLFFKVMTIYNALYALLLVRGIHNFVEHNQMFPCHGPNKGRRMPSRLLQGAPWVVGVRPQTAIADLKSDHASWPSHSRTWWWWWTSSAPAGAAAACFAHNSSTTKMMLVKLLE